MNKWILLFVSLFSMFAQASDLSLQVSPTDVHALPVSLHACSTGEELSPLGFTFPNLQLSWAGEGKLQIAFIRVQLKSENLASGSYQCQISGDELKAMFFPKDSLDQNLSTRAICGIRCGGLEVLPTTQANAVFNGKIMLVGVQFLENGQEKLVSTEVPVTVQYILAK